ncbi:MAG: GGDEF domain-containing protein [Alphaproteobacteria bacterium]|nr:GGDEF domain-containing protein [Alphaproteobacteria bacterium]
MTITLVTTVFITLLALAGMWLGNVVSNDETTAADVAATLALAVGLTAPLLGSLIIKLEELRHANAQLQYLASYDFLTGALNRRAFMEGVEKRLAEGGTSETKARLALFVIDVDHFKVINDRYGHQVGDLALVRIADALRASLRETDLFGRLGGEEFGAFLDDIAPVDALKVAEKCRLAIAECPFTPEGEQHSVSVSIGIAFAMPDEDFTTLFHQADNRLYRAKEHGRNRIEAPLVSVAA